ncbi:DNA-processing protein DprA [Leucobacter sp. W1478]|uniref:DNA-processing protein DprA n=1 Tax=Leucobacter sp. W1478 TaxID=3439065 RepID=UPI003F2A3436
MNTQPSPPLSGSDQLADDPQLRGLLARLARSTDVGQEHANGMLARIAWSRIAEPGDGVAGELLAALGAEFALQLLIQGATPVQLRNSAAEGGVNLGTRAAESALGRWLPRVDRAETIRDIERGIEAGLRVILPDDESWPILLDDLGPHAPLLLWVRGDPAHLATPSLSVVGARAATGYGTHVTAEIVDGVCAAGFSIVSGAAYGIDAVAHRTALAAETPTVAVLAGGADRAYPQSHDGLLGKVSETGAVCAEMVPGAAPTRWRFLQRNRIIAALSSATLVTEAGVRSGTLNTAGHAAELGRSLGAVPGPVTSAASAGCHKLIREYGAALITNAREACELAGLGDGVEVLREGSNTVGETLSPARQPSRHGRVLDALPLRGSRTLLEIARLSGLSVGDVRTTLAELELLQAVTRRDAPGAAELKWALARSQ